MLTETQTIVLSRAAQNDGIALPLPDHLKAGAAHKVVGALIRKDFLEEVEASRDAPVWRETGDGHGVTLRITDAGLAAIGIEPEAEPAPAEAEAAESPSEAGSTDAHEVEAAPAPRAMRSGTKQEQLIGLLKRDEGATIEQMVAATGWQSHTVRGAMAGALKKRLGLTITSDKPDGSPRVYRIES